MKGSVISSQGNDVCKSENVGITTPTYYCSYKLLLVPADLSQYVIEIIVAASLLVYHAQWCASAREMTNDNCNNPNRSIVVN